MTVFGVEGGKGYAVMSVHHLRDSSLSLKAKGLLCQNSAVHLAERVAQGLYVLRQRWEPEAARFCRISCEF